eukprot:TRINITY_DN15350_c0_g1_i1.p1 TRINITY_DN15350_c0_g1~~TRINITY_DN15350_c0_g1_i1.p1  ORF type:complete len:109 (-),score=7.14 TRINITY_DN15350_c0_g1_i1:63-389(-)
MVFPEVLKVLYWIVWAIYHGLKSSLCGQSSLIYGDIPESIANLTQLVHLDLEYCNFTGTFPNITSLTQLQNRMSMKIQRRHSCFWRRKYFEFLPQNRHKYAFERGIEV